MSRGLAIAIGVVVLLLAGVAVFVAVDLIGEDETGAEPATTTPAATVAVVRTDLVERETLEGTLGYRSPRTLFATAPGTVTGLPEGGTVLARGDVAYELDGRPVTVMFGDRPVWRALAEGVPDGPDVAQLEANLEALGFTADGALSVDETFDGATTSAVEEWQASMGGEETGIVGLADIVFVAAPVRVGVAATQTGAVVAPGSPMYAVTARNHDVLVLLDADRQDLLAAGDEVAVTLPDGTPTTGTVREVGRLVISSDEASGTGEGESRRVVEVRIDLADESLAAGIDEAPVDVDVASSTAEAVLAVPVEALLALAEGGYAVEVVASDGGDQEGSTRLVAVEVGTFADGLVEVTGDVEPGDVVVVPR
ncbi:MAG TPA: peptidoglycan-binding protein [Acidimicrobiia bacterium]